MGRDIQAIKISGEDRRQYRDKMRRSFDVFARMLRERMFEENSSTVGQEIELNLVDERGMPSMRNADVLEAIASPAWATEVGQFNLEINMPPRMLDGDAFATLEQEVRADLNAADARARTVGSHLVMVGILPTLAEQDVHEETMSANERYRVLNEQIFAARGGDMRIEIDGAEQLLTHVGSITPEAACTSVQLHVQVSPDAFGNYWNAAQAIAGVQVALAANSPFLFGRQLWHETRIPLFEQATDTRSDELKEQGVRPRVWFGERWITSVFDLFEENIRYFPALLPIVEDEDPMAVLDHGGIPQLAEMSLHNGTIYRWNRPVYGVVDGRPHLRVENRVLPTGPSIADVMANAAFYYGLVRSLAEAQRPIWTQMSFATAAENLHDAARDGLDAQLYWPGIGDAPVAELVLRRLLPLAREGLGRWGVDEAVAGRLLGIIEQRCLTGQTGAAWQIATVAELTRNHGLDRPEALRQMTQRYIEHMHTNQPVHTWPEAAAGGGGPQARDPAGGAAAGGGGPQARDPAGGGAPQARRRYLKGQCPESVPVGEPFSLLVSIVMSGSASAALKPFDVPPVGSDVLLVVHAPGLQLLGRQRLTVRVPAEKDSESVMFELRADAPGSKLISITAWLGGSYLGELLIEITAERDQRPGLHRDVYADITTESTEGAVSLVVRYDPAQNAYRFEFRDEDNPDEVTSNLAYDPGPRVEQLVAGLDELAKGRTGYSEAQAWRYLVNSGAGLWRELVPARLREQFWERQHRIRQLTILADKDAVPWELLYPKDPGHDEGFLVEQFPVTRAIFGRRPTRRLSLWPARFVLPEGSLPEARDEINAMRRMLDPEQPPEDVIFALTPLQDLIETGNFGLLHFACHNRFDMADGSSITMDNVQFTPRLMTTAAIDKVLSASAPTIFMNACRSAGLNATYNRLDGWASKFLEAGAGAFIGSLWAVSDGGAREFAQEFYGQLQTGSSLGEAVKRARHAAARHTDDPTWLAYTVYGDPRATIGQRRP